MLDMQEMAENPKPEPAATQKKIDEWIYSNKVCQHTILSTLSNELFYIYYSYKEAKEIWESIALKYIAEDARRQKFMIENCYRWEMTSDKDIWVQINEYNILLENLKAEKFIYKMSSWMGCSSKNY